MIMSLKQRKIKFDPGIKLNYNIYMSDFMKTGSALFSALCAKFALKVFFSPETISKVDDIKTKGNVIFFLSSPLNLLTLSRCLTFFFFVSRPSFKPTKAPKVRCQRDRGDFSLTPFS